MLAGGCAGPRDGAVTGLVPEYYVALSLIGDGGCCRPGLLFAPLTEAVVRATATGDAVATVLPPAPYGTFTGVTAAADGRTFVVVAQKLARLPLRVAPATGFFLLHITPDSPSPGDRAQLTPLPAADQAPGTRVSGLALSPDATRLAVTAGPLFNPAVHVLTLATGASRAWSGRAGPGLGPGAARGSLSWTADGRTLALISDGVRLLDTAAPGASLTASSRLVLPGRDSMGPFWRQAIISPDGQVIAAVIQITAHDGRGHIFGVTQKLATFSATTGEQLGTLNHIPVHGGYQQILWASPSAHLLIVSGTQPGPTVGPFNLGHSAAILSDGRLTPIPWSNRIFAAAW